MNMDKVVYALNEKGAEATRVLKIQGDMFRSLGQLICTQTEVLSGYYKNESAFHDDNTPLSNEEKLRRKMESMKAQFEEMNALSARGHEYGA